MTPSARKTNSMSLFSGDYFDPQICFAFVLRVAKVSRLLLQNKSGTSSLLLTNVLVIHDEE